MGLKTISTRKAILVILCCLQIVVIILLGKTFLNSGHKAYTTLPMRLQALSNITGNLQLFNLVRNNSVYRNFEILHRGRRESINLLVIVSSAPKRLDRRNAIRETWWSLCRSNKKVTVRCYFMTDKPSNTSVYRKQIEDESKNYKDLEFQALRGGVEFGKRFLYHMLWAVRNFEFDYFLRIDDDYYMCMDKLINELPLPAMALFHWGWAHCIDDITRPEESIILLSSDVIKLFLMQDPDKMRCHPWADQMIGLWVEDLDLRNMLLYRTDVRLHHEHPSKTIPKLLKGDVCHDGLGVHGSYPAIMRKFWQKRGNYELKNETLLANSQICRSNQKFNWNAFTGFWLYRPKLCKENPTWETSKQGNGSSFGGRQEGFGR